MGTDLAFIYDIIAAAIIIGAVFVGWKRGFACVIVRLASVFVAFFCAMSFSAPISSWVYTSVVEQPLETAVDGTIDEVMGKVTLSSLSDLDYDAVKIDGIDISEYNVDYAGTNKALIDLAHIDLSGTGIADDDLTLFGIESDMDFSEVSAGVAEFEMKDIESYGLGKLVVAQYVAYSMRGGDTFSSLGEYVSSIGEALPLIFGDTAQQLNNGSLTALRGVVLNMINTSGSVKESIINGIIEPNVKGISQTIVFILIFAVVSLVLSLAAHALKLVNKIPLIGSVNAVLGAVSGVIEGVIVVFVVCIVFRLVISLSGGNIYFLNEIAVNSTVLFSKFYNFELLNFLG